MRMLGALIVCAATLLGCGGTAAGDPESTPPSPAAFTISYERGGGLTGGTEGLVVRPGLHAVATSTGSRAGDRRVRFQIGAGRVRALARGLSRAHFAGLPGDSPANCADCYIYAIGYRGHRVRLAETAVPPALGEVIGEIEAVISAHAIPPNA